MSGSHDINTLWTGDADLRLYITTVQDGWRKSMFLTRAWFPRTIHLITQYMEHFSEWSYWRMFIETRVFGEYFLKISVHENTRVETLIVATIYLQLIQNRYMEVLLSFNVVTSIVYNPLPAMWKS